MRAEVYRIAGEALRNAFKHAQAQRIEVELRMTSRNFGCGSGMMGGALTRSILMNRGAHYGLRGMRERAKLMGGKVAVWSELDSGTELELSIPAANAYAMPDGGKRFWLAEKLSGKGRETKP